MVKPHILMREADLKHGLILNTVCGGCILISRPSSSKGNEAHNGRYPQAILENQRGGVGGEGP